MNYVAVGKQVYPKKQCFQIQEEQSSKEVSQQLYQKYAQQRKHYSNLNVANLETVDNGGKSALLNTKETAILYDFSK